MITKSPDQSLLLFNADYVIHHGGTTKMIYFKYDNFRTLVRILRACIGFMHTQTLFNQLTKLTLSLPEVALQYAEAPEGVVELNCASHPHSRLEIRDAKIHKDRDIEDEIVDTPFFMRDVLIEDLCYYHQHFLVNNGTSDESIAVLDESFELSEVNGEWSVDFIPMHGPISGTILNTVTYAPHIYTDKKMLATIPTDIDMSNLSRVAVIKHNTRNYVKVVNVDEGFNFDKFKATEKLVGSFNIGQSKIAPGYYSLLKKHGVL